ncbi:hypothetical protein D9M71_322400 [compost metagenome]
MNGIDRNAFRPKITYQASVETGDCAFGQGVEGCCRERGITGHGRTNVNNPATVFHIANSFLGGDEYTRDVDGNHALVVFKLDALNRAAEGEASVVHQNVDTAKCFNGLCNGYTHGCGITSISQDRNGASACFGNGLYDFFSLGRRSTVGERNQRTISSQALGNSSTNRTGTASNQGDFSSKLESFDSHEHFTLGLR